MRPQSQDNVSRVTVEQLRPGDSAEYDDFLLGRPETLLYHSSRYRDFLRALLGCGEEYLVAREGVRVRGALPLLYAERDGRRVYNSLPYYGSNGGVVADTDDACRELVAAYREITLRGTTLASTVVGNPFAPQGGDDLPHNFTDYRIGQFTHLSLGANGREELLARIDASARRNVAKAAREGIAVDVDHSQLPRLREMHQENIRAVGGLPKTDQFFRLVPEFFEPGRDFDLYVARRDGQVVAGLLIFYFNRTVEYFTPAVDAEHRSLQPLALILAEAMADAARRGFSWWNWGGTWATQDGVYRFKRKWGVDERRYDYHTQLNDEAVLRWPREKFLSTFPGFYVVAFSALKTEG